MFDTIGGETTGAPPDRPKLTLEQLVAITADQQITDIRAAVGRASIQFVPQLRGAGAPS
jgi:hypothetical protein